MKDFIKQKLNPLNGTLRNKLVFSMLFIAVAITTASVVGFWNATLESNRLLYKQTASTLGFFSEKITGRLDNISSISDAFTLNITVQESLQKLGLETDSALLANARTRIYESIYRVFQSDMISITVIPTKGPQVVWGATSQQETSQRQAVLLKEATAANGGILWIPSEQSDGSVLCVREILSVSEPFLGHLGYLIIRVDFNRLVYDSSRSAAGISEYDIGIYNGTQRLYPSGEHPAEAPVMGDADMPYVIGTVNGKMQFITYSSITTKNINWRMALTTPYDQVFASMVHTVLFYVGLLLLALIAVLVFAGFMLRSITGQFKLLVYKMQRVRAGDLEPVKTDAPIYNDELGILNIQFDKMTADFKRVIDDNYVKELLLTQTQLKSLEQQMNPHFLYNALESIRWSARRSGDNNCMVIAKSLGDLLRESLSGTQAVIPVRKELEIIQSYLNIQAIRFSDTLRTRICCPEEAMDFLVPKMSVQPLIENAVIHALEENIGICTVSLCVEKNGDFLRVSVGNDGSSIEENILEKLRSGQVQPNGNGIGLLNIDTRIKLLYGKEYGLAFQSRGETVTVSYEIPALLEMKKEQTE